MKFYRTNDDELTISKGSVSFRYKVNGLNRMVDNDLTSKYILIPQDIPLIFQPKTRNLRGNFININFVCVVFQSSVEICETEVLYPSTTKLNFQNLFFDH